MINNNDIMKKLRVALKLRDADIVKILRFADFEITESELSAFFRREGHPHYRPCGDQIVRRFLDGLIVRNRGVRENGSQHVPGPGRGKAGGKKPRVVKPGQPRMMPVRKVDTIRVYRAEGS